ncbi:6-phosphogluconolactonase [Pontibaca salina]|uniref:6-phosphogluconolactonase n=1 Tax=Pontibaca salina TaxID=2795731 RepID=A0A934HR31_9RHOB|nr:6-phosphogluconolactonase [Pontibaca salina]MBI6629902.1 6-phosphogluconolactonase [Pontibaca salina]
MNLIEYPDRDMLAINLANLLAGELKATLLSHDTASIAVPGGTTPGPIFDALCAAPLEWDKVMVLPTDERWVTPDDPRSNARLIREHLLVGRAAEAKFLSLHGTGAHPEDDLDAIAAQIEPALPLSVLLLGMGEDCHVASLFPGTPGLAAALADDAPALAAMAPAGQPEARITLTAPVLDGALKKHLVILGWEKRDALERAQSLSPEEAPVQAVLSEMNVHWAV